MRIRVITADYSNEQHQRAIPMLLDKYASDPMGGGQALNENVKANLVNELSKLPHAFSVIAYVDDIPAGLINAFEAFSTFSCKPLINIHDVMVLDEYRGNGICREMLNKVEQIARSKGCCKITLEVLSGNEIAKSVYNKLGFAGYELDPRAGVAQFWQKKLVSE
jgi:ribosomal protein S18 acetylase RimI-like enzyme